MANRNALKRKSGRTYVKKPFESMGVYIVKDANGEDKKMGDTSANIYESMLRSEAWKQLTPRQKVLYLTCKGQLYAEKRKPRIDGMSEDQAQECFTMSRQKYCEIYGLYRDNYRKPFYEDIDALIAYGFIVCVASGKISRRSSIYRYSDMWQKWGTSEFEVLPNQMTTSGMRRAARPKKETSVGMVKFNKSVGDSKQSNVINLLTVVGKNKQ